MSGIATETMFHVLAVDDSIIDRKLIERLLKTSSYQVTAVDSAVKALEFLGLLDDENTNSNCVSTTRNHHKVEVNLIITDYSMPAVTGYDLLRKIKESTLLKDIPVVIMSSENEGAEEFFLKPVQQSNVNKLRPHLMRRKCRQNQPNINKRKPLEECLSPDRTRTRYNDLELVQ
ncbi:hypothetical protein Pfo_001795 [Paulownia fortunei]|nr:hypothetical protein Pfo_001795 [Paulownia fortunei]